jgi:hypothetical protein
MHAMPASPRLDFAARAQKLEIHAATVMLASALNQLGCDGTNLLPAVIVVGRATDLPLLPGGEIADVCGGIGGWREIVEPAHGGLPARITAFLFALVLAPASAIQSKAPRRGLARLLGLQTFRDCSHEVRLLGAAVAVF